MSRVLVISPHPDDEAIGCAGALCEHIAAGDEVRVVFLSSGEAGGHGAGRAETRVRRESEAAAAADVLGIAAIDFWRLPDGKLRADAALVAQLAGRLREWTPQTLYTTHPGEAHPDHRVAPRALRRALAASGISGISGCEVWHFEVWTPLATMDRIVDISPWMETKLRAVRAYASQCEVLRFDDAVAGLNRWRGEMHSWPGGDYAEVFTAMAR